MSTFMIIYLVFMGFVGGMVTATYFMQRYLDDAEDDIDTLEDAIRNFQCHIEVIDEMDED